MLERVLVALLAGGHVLLEGVPGLAKTLTVKTVAGRARRPVQAPAVHAGPRARGPRRHAHLPPGHAASFDTELGPVFCNFLLADEINRAPAKVAVGAARGHAGAPGDDRPRDAPRPGAVPRARDAEPDRVRGHVPAARGAGRPLHVQARRRLPVAPRRGRRSSSARLEAGTPSPARCSSPEQLADAPARRRHGLRRPARDGVRRRADHRDARPGRRRTGSSSAPRRAARSTSIHAGRALALLRGRDYMLPVDVRDLARDVLRHRIVLTYEALAAGVDCRPRPR